MHKTLKILVATTNPGKLSEISQMLDFDIDWVSLSDFPDTKEIIEDGKTFAENARKKALGYAKQTHLWTLADDSGLVVDALNGAPGVNSARFSCLAPTPAVGVTKEYLAAGFTGGSPKNRQLLDHKNMQKVLTLLKDIPKQKRTARFACSLCLASPQKVLLETEGKLEGIIAEKEAGSNGFGYDPIFFLPDLDKTVAQLSVKEKNSISHRGNAVRKFAPLLHKLIQNQKP
ncbi:MAG: non-canonical purine NTP pyrophosphatase, RdgB/HAM1 family [Planctomycetes bacterium RBG_13_46_10]|nr:MAG: non-canonical purine NTP pyrophosphatase, RdgB/HAM1 family [Planctomycetes bacterium RBG_13_46_10]